MINIYKNTVQQKKLAQISDFSRMSWINVVNPTEDEKRKIEELFNIPADVLDDSFDSFELPRVKMQNGNLIIILRIASKEGEKYATSPFTVILNDSYIATIGLCMNELVDDFVSGKYEIITTQQSNFFIKICHRIVDYYQNYIITINRSVGQKRKNIRSINKNDIFFLVETEETLNSMLASLNPTINVINKILNYNHINLYRNDKELISDLLVDGQQVVELCGNTLRTIRNIRDGYTTVMSINLNQIIELLTYITALFTIPMLVTSAYGMNLAMPFHAHPFAFVIVGAITLLLVVFGIWLFMYIRKRI